MSIRRWAPAALAMLAGGALQAGPNDSHCLLQNRTSRIWVLQWTSGINAKVAVVGSGCPWSAPHQGWLIQPGAEVRITATAPAWCSTLTCPE